LVVSDDIYVMLLTQAKFKEFTPKAICDATKSTEVLVCLSCEGREQVNSMVSTAVGGGGTTYAEAKDYGFMYQHGFQDLDGHIWELIYMEPSAIKQG
jgi:predicted lactoylglutathione lyase